MRLLDTADHIGEWIQPSAYWHLIHRWPRRPALLLFEAGICIWIRQKALSHAVEPFLRAWVHCPQCLSSLMYIVRISPNVSIWIRYNRAVSLRERVIAYIRLQDKKIRSLHSSSFLDLSKTCLPLEKRGISTCEGHWTQRNTRLCVLDRNGYYRQKQKTITGKVVSATVKFQVTKAYLTWRRLETTSRHCRKLFGLR